MKIGTGAVRVGTLLYCLVRLHTVRYGLAQIWTVNFLVEFTGWFGLIHFGTG